MSNLPTAATTTTHTGNREFNSVFVCPTFTGWHIKHSHRRHTSQTVSKFYHLRNKMSDTIFSYSDFIDQFPQIPHPKVSNFIMLHNIFVEKVIKMLRIRDIMCLAQTCKYFYTACSSDRIWRSIYEIYFETYSPIVIESKFFQACRRIYFVYYPNLEYIIKGIEQERERE